MGEPHIVTPINENDLGSWPRRLLHVPSMTSHAWQYGNRYGSFIEPSYNVVSYTWGRYELRGSAMPEVKAVAIHGLTWDVPRIQPTHFSTQDFERLIQTSINYRSRQVQRQNSNGLPTQHLWLDIACIDQEDERMKMSEIGRQAKIFENADTALIWLNHHGSRRLEQTLQQFVVAIEQLEKEPELDSAKTAADGLATLLQDPWFSSLWTLQEAFLRKDALLLSLQGESVLLNGYLIADPRLLTLCCSGLLQVPASYLQDYVPVSQWKDLVRLKDAIQKSGLGLLYSDSPIVLYTGARFRNSTFELDRIYGIMQTFDLRLGTTSEGAENQKFTLVELEDQLGAALIKKWPIRSQFHIHTKAPLSVEAGELVKVLSFQRFRWSTRLDVAMLTQMIGI